MCALGRAWEELLGVIQWLLLCSAHLEMLLLLVSLPLRESRLFLACVVKGGEQHLAGWWCCSVPLQQRGLDET